MDLILRCAPSIADTATESRNGLEPRAGSNSITTILLKKLLFALCVFALALTSSMPKTGAAEEYQWKIGHVRPAGTAIDNDTKWFVEKIFKETDGKINITIYPSSQLGDYTVAQEKTSFGGIDMYIGPFGTMTDRRLLLPNTPYLVTDWSEAKKIYSPGSFLLKKMSALLEAQNIKILGGWPVYFGGIVLTEEPEEPANPNISKDMIIRVPPIRSFVLTAEALGYTPYPITWLYARDGLKTGMVKGIMGGGAEGYEGLGDLAKYYIVAKDHFEYWFIYMNLDLWKGLSEEYKAIIQQSAVKMEKRRYAVAESEEAASIERLRQRGTDVIELTDEQLIKIEQKVHQSVWPVLREEVGDVFDEVVSSVKTDETLPK